MPDTTPNKNFPKRPAGEYSRQTTGTAINSTLDEIDAFLAGITETSVDKLDLAGDRVTFTPLAAPPDNPVPTMTVVADGTNWDPDVDGNAEMVTYDGTGWVEIVDYATTF